MLGFSFSVYYLYDLEKLSNLSEVLTVVERGVGHKVKCLVPHLQEGPHERPLYSCATSLHLSSILFPEL